MRFTETITRKIDKIVLFFALAVLSISLYLVYNLSQDYRKKETITSLDTMLTFTKNMLEEEQQRALSLALLLSEDREVLDAYGANDRQRVFAIITRKIKRLEQMQGYHFEVQVHDRELKTYLRSWDFSIQGVPLASFREGLVLARKSGKPLVSIEVGKRLNIKAIAPILHNGRFQGSIEVIEGFGHLRKRLAEQGYRLYILLDKRYLSIATTLAHAPLVSGRYVLVGDVEDREGLDALGSASLDALGSFGYFTRLGHLFGYFDLRNYHNDRLGYLLITSVKRASPVEEVRHETSSVEINRSGVIIR